MFLVLNMNIPQTHIFRTISDRYGQAMLKRARHWESLAKRRTNNYEKLTFLHYCIHNNLPLKSLWRKPPIDIWEACVAMRQYQRRMMYAMIIEHHRLMPKLQQSQNTMSIVEPYCHRNISAPLSHKYIRQHREHGGVKVIY